MNLEMRSISNFQRKMKIDYGRLGKIGKSEGFFKFIENTLYFQRKSKEKKMKTKKKSGKIKQIALERIQTLFNEAEKVFKKDPKLANRYVFLARKISMKAKARIPSRLKRRFCKHCYSYLMPGVNVRVRTQRGKVVYYCLNCKKYMRFPYIREQKARRRKIL